MVKAILPNQCYPLHFLYGRDDCCLCAERLKVVLLEERIEKLENQTLVPELDGDSNPVPEI